MGSSLEFVEYIAGQLSEAGIVTYRKMFGEYGLFCNGKFFAVICGDQFFVKITQAGRRVYPDFEEAPPYEGAKPYFLIDSDERELLTEFVVKTCGELPPPKPKKIRKK